MTYEYLCAACGHEWEAQQSISESPLKDCPKCGQAQAKRQVSGGAGFILKGGGWYADGYASGKKSESSSTKTTSTSTASSGDAKSGTTSSSSDSGSGGSGGSGSKSTAAA